MTRGRYRWLVFSFLLVLVLLDRLWHVSLFSLVPLFLIAPLLLAWHPSQPLRWVVGWGGVALLLTTASPVVVGAVTLLPWLVRRLLPRVQIDFSFSFLVTLLITVALQLGFIFKLVAVPWAIVVPMWLLAAGVAGTALLVAQQIGPDA